MFGLFSKSAFEIILLNKNIILFNWLWIQKLNFPAISSHEIALQCVLPALHSTWLSSATDSMPPVGAEAVFEKCSRSLGALAVLSLSFSLSLVLSRSLRAQRVAWKSGETAASGLSAVAPLEKTITEVKLDF